MLIVQRHITVNDPDFENYLRQMYSTDLEINDTPSSDLDLHLSNGMVGQLCTSLNDKLKFFYTIIDFWWSV